MANEITFGPAEMAGTYYALRFNLAGGVWNGSAFVTMVLADWATYAIALTESPAGSGYYRASLPVPSTAGSVEIRLQAGGSPASTDTTVGEGDISPVATGSISAGFRWTAGSLYDQVIQELGGGGMTPQQGVAIKNRIREGATEIWHAFPWSWRRKRMNVTVTAGTPYFALPYDYDSMVNTRLFGVDSGTGEEHIVKAVADSEFDEQIATQIQEEPKVFRITRRMADKTASSNYSMVLEVAPPPDQTYTYQNAQYHCSCPTIDFTSDTPLDMPTEFHDIWHERAVADAADVMHQHETAAVHLSKYEKKLTNAKEHRDTNYPSGEPLGVVDVYHDVSRLR